MPHHIRRAMISHYFARVELLKDGEISYQPIGKISQVSRDLFQLSLSQSNAITNANGILGPSIEDVYNDLASRMQSGLSKVR